MVSSTVAKYMPCWYVQKVSLRTSGERACTLWRHHSTLHHLGLHDALPQRRCHTKLHTRSLNKISLDFVCIPLQIRSFCQGVNWLKDSLPWGVRVCEINPICFWKQFMGLARWCVGLTIAEKSFLAWYRYNFNSIQISFPHHLIWN